MGHGTAINVEIKFKRKGSSVSITSQKGGGWMWAQASENDPRRGGAAGRREKYGIISTFSFVYIIVFILPRYVGNVIERHT